jgi:hypothetical protein
MAAANSFEGANAQWQTGTRGAVDMTALMWRNQNPPGYAATRRFRD